jgi:hypothetical protein
MVRVREFNDAGIEKFRYYLISMRETGESETLLTELLSDETYTKILLNKIEVEPQNFPTKFAIAGYLHEKVSGISPAKKYRNIGMWTWLAAFYFDVLCPADENGTRKIGEESRYILNGDEWDRIFRHLLAGPVMIYDLHHANSIVLLYNPVDETGDFLAQLMGRQEIGTNRAVIEAAKLLYWDEEKKRPKRGSSPQEHKPGTLRRFVDVLQQFDLTYDLYSISGDELIQLLPGEFDTGKNNVKSKTVKNHEEQPTKRHIVLHKTRNQESATEEISRHTIQDKKIPQLGKKWVIEEESRSDFLPKKSDDAKPILKPEIKTYMKDAMKSALPLKRPLIKPAATDSDAHRPKDIPDLPTPPKQEKIYETAGRIKVETPPYCQNCGKKIPPAAHFCPKCGKKLRT